MASSMTVGAGDTASDGTARIAKRGAREFTIG